jgi:hypothetical protein
VTAFWWLLLVVLAVVVYRSVPTCVSSISGVLMAPEVVRRGFLADGQIILGETQARMNEVWPRWCRRNIALARVPALVWIDTHLFVVWYWVWPVWLVPRVVITRRLLQKTMDRWWRR